MLYSFTLRIFDEILYKDDLQCLLIVSEGELMKIIGFGSIHYMEMHVKSGLQVKLDPACQNVLPLISKSATTWLITRKKITTLRTTS